VKETIDPNAKIEFRPNTEDRKPDITKAKDLLGWQVSLRKGLPLMVEDFRRRVFGDEKDGSIKNKHTSLNDS
jgi:UDP-glucuronate decarboxylase